MRFGGKMDDGVGLEDFEQVCDPNLVSLVTGYFAARAGLPVIPHAPLVREVQLTQLRVALPWAARALGLPPPA